MAEQHGVDGWAWTELPRKHTRCRRHYFRAGASLCGSFISHHGAREVSDVAEARDCKTCRRLRLLEQGTGPAVMKARTEEADWFNLIRLRLLAVDDVRGWIAYYGEDVRWLLERLGEAPPREPG